VEQNNAAIAAGDRRRGDRMKRRKFVRLLTAAVIGWTFPAKAQQAEKSVHIAYLSVAAGRNPLDETFEQALQQLG
jgi:hypothetical protein